MTSEAFHDQVKRFVPEKLGNADASLVCNPDWSKFVFEAHSQERKLKLGISHP